MSAGLSLGSAAAAACKKKDLGAGAGPLRTLVVRICHRGSLLPRHFVTFESRVPGRISQLASVLVVRRYHAVGRQCPLGAR